MKRTNKFVIVALCVASILCCVAVLTACSEQHVCKHVCKICGKCTDKNCTDPVCADKCKGHGGKVDEKHICQHICHVCNGCLDADCTDDVCAKKCGDGKEEHILDPLNSYVEKSGVFSVMTDENGEKFVGNFASMYQSSLRFTFTSDKDAVATLVVNIGKRVSKTPYTDSVTVLLNDDFVESAAEVPVAADSNSWTEFTDVVLGCFNIKKGLNTLELIPVDSDLTKIYNFRCAKLLGDFKVEIAPHACASKCEECGGCKNIFCDQAENCAVKCTCSPYSVFSVVDDKVVVEGIAKNTNEGIVGVKIGGTVTITFNINVPVAGKYSVKAMVSSGASDVTFSSVYQVTINGTELSTSAVMPEGMLFGDYKDVELGEYDFLAGKNTVVVTSHATDNSRTWYNIRSIGIGIKGCTFFEEAEQPHVCSHVCEICKNCKNADCTDPVCENKCDCPLETVYTVFDVVDDEVIVKGIAKNIDEGIVGVQVGGKVTITFNFNVLVAGSYSVKVVVSSGAAGVGFSSVYGVTVNGHTVETSVLMPEGAQFGDYKEIELGKFDFVEGKNTVVVESNATGDSNTWYNFKSMAVGIGGCTYFVEKHVCSDVCETCNKCKDRSCTDSVCANKCTCAVTVDKVDGAKFAVLDDKVTVSGTIKNTSEGVVGIDASGGTVVITFRIIADKAAKATLLIETSANDAPTLKATQLYVTQVNGVAVNSDATLPVGNKFSDYQVTTLGEIDIVEGENIITFSVTGSMDVSTWYNFKTMILQTEATVTLA